MIFASKEKLVIELKQYYAYLGKEKEYYSEKKHSRCRELLINKSIFLKKYFTECECFVALGCGNSVDEIALMQNFNDRAIYVGVDKSMEMLEMSKDALSKFPCDYELINDDFYSLNACVDFVKKYKNIICTMIGGTLGNSDERIVVEKLKSIIGDGLFVFDVNCALDDKDVYEFLGGMNNQLVNYADFYLNSLSVLGFDASCSVLEGEMTEDDLCYRYNFFTYLFLDRKVDRVKVIIFTIKCYKKGGIDKMLTESKMEIVEDIYYKYKGWSTGIYCVKNIPE